MHLVEKEADVTAIDGRGYSVLDCAVSTGCVQVVEYLIDSAVSIESSGSPSRTPLLLAVQLGHLEMIKLLASRGANIHASSSYGNSVPMLATQRPGIDIDVVKCLIDNGAT